MTKLLKEPTILSEGNYLQIVIKLKFLNDAIIRSNDPEEVLTYSYNEPLGNRFVIPWRKVKGKLRRVVMEKQRDLGIEKDCSLKDNLCMQCPSCFIFGGTGETSTADVPYNILARIMGETFISTTKVEEIQPYTQNAVDEKTLTTGQALMSILPVPAETEFIGVLTLRDATPEMVSIVIDNLNRLTRIGARSVEWGRIETKILGIKLSDRETLSSYYLATKSEQEIEENLIKLNNNKIGETQLPSVEEAYKKLDEQVKEIIKKLGESPKKVKKSKKGRKEEMQETEEGEEE